jgi:class 3 adenylate cyclase
MVRLCSNIAARVQTSADSGEICLTEALYAVSGVRQLLARHDVKECGVEGNARLYRVTGRP